MLLLKFEFQLSKSILHLRIRYCKADVVGKRCRLVCWTVKSSQEGSENQNNVEIVFVEGVDSLHFYDENPSRRRISDVNINTKSFEVFGRIIHVAPVIVWNKVADAKVFSFTLADKTGRIRVVFFNKFVDK